MFTCSRKRSPRCFVSLADLAELKFAWQDLAASTDEGDVGKFTDAVKEFDSMTRLDPWKTTLLLKAKNELKKKEEDEDDLT